MSQVQKVLASVDRFVPLRALDRSNLHRQRVHRPSITRPRRKIEMPTGGNFVNAYTAKRERGIWLANFGRLCGTKKVSASPGAHHRGFSIRLHKHRRSFVNRNFSGSSRPSVMDDAGEEAKRSSHAIALGEMGVGKSGAKQINLQEVTPHRDAAEVRICQHLRGSKVGIVGCVTLRRIDVLPQDRQCAR